MLAEIHIKDFALIDTVRLTLESGFNVLTGETGAGKSIIIDAISAVIGQRIGADMVRAGSQRAIVEAAFDLGDSPAAEKKSAELGVDAPDGVLLISREISAEGKTQSRVNGRLSTLSMLREITAGLLDVHGQHEHQSLLAIDNHLDILDHWCGREILEIRGEVEEHYSEHRELRSKLAGLQGDERERVKMLDLYQFQRDEIDGAKLIPGEDEELFSERSRLANAERLYELATSAYIALSGGEGNGGGVDSLASALTHLQSMETLDDSLSEVVRDLKTALYAAEQVQAQARSYRDEVEFNPNRLEAVEERLDIIRSLKRKYGDSIEEIIAYGEDAAKKIDGLEHSEERTAELQQQLERIEVKLMDAARKLSSARKAAAADFTAAVEDQLADLAMANTRFEISFEETAPSVRGVDRAEFMIAPNPGEPLKPLAKIASGGEMSRVMLALKTVLAGADAIPTLIFDEIDSGIGGRTAQALGQKLASVAENAQVICVTHLPQIASQADIHFSVDKRIEGERTVIRVRSLEGDARVEELARMLGSDEDSKTAAAHAREMLETAGARKR